jgi:hypothetical protein
MFLQAWGLAALLAVPAVIALHLYRRRFQPRPVSALFLWDQASISPLTGRTRTPLLRSPSFWCEVLAAFFLAILLAKPGGCGESRHRVVVLDGSASMAASGVSEAARTAAGSYLSGLYPWEKATVLVSGRAPSVLAGPGAAPSAAIAAIAGWSPAEPDHALDAALELARASAEGGNILLVTDGEVEGLPLEVGLKAVGKPQPNAAIVQADRRTSPGELDRVILVVLWSGPESTVELTHPGGVEKFQATAGFRKIFEFRIEPGQPFNASVTGPGDALALDNKLLIPVVARRNLRLGATDPATLEFGLGSRAKQLDRLSGLVPGVEPGEPSDFSFGAGSPCSLIPKQGTGTAIPPGPLLVEDHPATTSLTMEGAIWSAWPELVLPGTPLIRAGGLTVFSQLDTDYGIEWYLNLDPLRSNVTRLTDWPMLLANLLILAKEQLPGPVHSLMRVGEPLVWHRAEAGSWFWSALDRVVEHPGGELVLPPASVPGVFEVSGPEGLKRELSVALLDASESELKGRLSLEKAPPEEKPASPSEVPELLLACLILALISLDFYVLGRQYEPS